jgi:phosphatidylserine/phosphatidylglycerophosphate/cardiolipin synthase-like enzyme
MDGASTRQLVSGSQYQDLEAFPRSVTVYSGDYVSKVSGSRRSPSSVLKLTTGTGFTIYTDHIIPAILKAQNEVILVTCFWAASATRDSLHTALLELSAKALESASRIRVQICFSSNSLARNMLLPTPKDGQRYKTEQWTNLGLPSSSEIPGLDLTIMRKFFWPFGIIHSKYVIVDRKFAIMPSCNVSWERWFEAAVAMEGPVVDRLCSFHANFWMNNQSLPAMSTDSSNQIPQQANSASKSKPFSTVQTTLLPSPHTWSLLPAHLQPKRLVSRLPCLPSTPPSHPPTPLLTTTAHLLSTASHAILMLTPNVTAPTVLSLLRHALSRGVNITIWTNQTLMTAEQLVTAGSTTPRCLTTLIRESAKMPGQLAVRYFDAPSSPGGQGATDVEAGRKPRESTPIKLHAKVTIVDEDKILLGSGNMDAASWGTSQELGVLLESKAIVEAFKEEWPFAGLNR